MVTDFNCFGFAIVVLVVQTNLGNSNKICAMYRSDDNIRGNERPPTDEQAAVRKQSDLVCEASGICIVAPNDSIISGIAKNTLHLVFNRIIRRFEACGSLH